MEKLKTFLEQVDSLFARMYNDELSVDECADEIYKLMEEYGYEWDDAYRVIVPNFNDNYISTLKKVIEVLRHRLEFTVTSPMLGSITYVPSSDKRRHGGLGTFKILDK